MTRAAYARHRGCHPSTVDEAIESGRLARALRKDERGRVRNDPEAADAEWEATTRAEYRPLTGPAATSGEKDPDIAESRRRHEYAKARMAEIDLQERMGKLCVAADMERVMVEAYTRAKTKLLGIPSRLRQQDPGLTLKQIALVESLIRETLEELAAGEPESSQDGEARHV